MIARACKEALRSNLRRVLRLTAASHEQEQHTWTVAEAHELQQAVIAETYDGVVDFFNLVLGTGADSDRFWNQVLPKRLARKFGHTERVLATSIFRPALFMRLQQLTGVLFHVHAYDWEEPGPNPLSTQDVFIMFPRCKTINVASMWPEWSDGQVDALLDGQQYHQARLLLALKLQALELANVPPLPQPEYLQTALQLTDVHLKLKQVAAARDVLTSVWDMCSYYPSLLALAQVTAARLEWCDGDAAAAVIQYQAALHTADSYFGLDSPVHLDIELNVARWWHAAENMTTHEHSGESVRPPPPPPGGVY